MNNLSILSQQLVYVSEILYYLIQSCLKFSVLAFYWRLFNSTYLRYWIYWMIPIVTLWSLAGVSKCAKRIQSNPTYSVFLVGHHRRCTMPSNRSIVEDGPKYTIQVYQSAGILPWNINSSHHPRYGSDSDANSSHLESHDPFL